MNENEYVDINAHDNYPDSDQKIEIPTMKVLPLKKICMTIGELPTSYLETMTYYEMLVWFIEYLKNNIIPTVNNNAEAVQEVQGVVLELQNYINAYKDSIDQDVEDLEEYMNNYFENLDVQEEINNKLDNMVEAGTLQEIIADYLNSKALFGFDTVANMKEATNLINGSYAKTLGFYEKNDGGSATYKIRTITNDDVVDNSSIIPVYDDNLVAELIIIDDISINAFGCYGDNTHDDTEKFQIALNKSLNIKLNENCNYKISETLNIKNNTKITGAGTTSKITSYIDNGSPLFYNNDSVMHFIIQDFYIDGNNKNCYGFVFTNPYDICIFKNLYFDNFIKACLKLGNNERVSQTLLIDNCCVYMSATAELNTPIFDLTKCYESNILNNKLLNRQDNYNDGPCLLLTNVYDNNIQGNSFTCSHDCAIKIIGSDCRHNRIISNTYELIDSTHSIKLIGDTGSAILHTLIMEAYTYYSAPNSVYCENESNGFIVGMNVTGGRRNLVLNVNSQKVQNPAGNCILTADNQLLTSRGFGVNDYDGVKKYEIFSNEGSSADYGLEIKNTSVNRKFQLDLTRHYFGTDVPGGRIKVISPDGNTTKYIGIDNNGELQVYNSYY